jgi:hypothetical protein
MSVPKGALYVKQLVKRVFGEDKISEQHHKKNNGTSVVISSTKLCSVFEQFGTSKLVQR